MQQAGHSSVPMRKNNDHHVDKKTRLEVEQDDMLQQQQYNQHQDPTEQDPRTQAWMRNQKRFLESLKPHIPKQGIQRIPPNVRPYQVTVLSSRLMMFLHHITQRPDDSCITFWRKLVAEYFSPRAKERLCLSQYKRAGHLLGMLPQDMWQCSLCGTKSGKGVEVTYDGLARLFEIKFASGIINELVYLGEGREYVFGSGRMVLEYIKAVQTTVYEKCRVVREGHLRITFSQDLKILSWEFCARSHEEFLVRRFIAPQVNQLLQAAQKYQSTIAESEPKGVSQQDLQTNSNMVLEAGRQLAEFTGLQSLNHLGYPIKYFRALQISEVVKSMKDLMDFTYDHRLGPIEGWKLLSEQTATMRQQRQKMQEMELFRNSGVRNRSGQAQMALNPGNNNNFNNHHQIVGRGAVNGSAQAAAALTNIQSMLMRLDAMNNPYSNMGKLDGFSSQRLSPYLSQQWQNLGTGRFTSSPQMQQLLGTMYGAPDRLQKNHPQHLLQPPHSQGNNQEQQELDQIRPEVHENASVQQQQAFLGQNGSNINAERNPTGYTSNISGGGQVPSRNNSVVAASNNNLHLPEDATEIRDGFSEDNFSNESDI